MAGILAASDTTNNMVASKTQMCWLLYNHDVSCLLIYYISVPISH